MTSVSRGRPVAGRPRRRAGWWFWGPFIWGLFFFIPGIGLLIGAGIVGGSSQGGLGGTGILFTVMGAGGLGVAWYAARDIHSEDPPPPLPGSKFSEVPSASALESSRPCSSSETVSASSTNMTGIPSTMRYRLWSRGL